MNKSTIMVGSVPDSKLMRSKCSQVMIKNQWGERTISELVDMARRTALRRNLTLYILMPYHKPVFDHLARMPDVKTIQNFNLDGMSELEVLLSDMALGATCDLFIPDAFSSLTLVVSSMKGGVGLMPPQSVVVEDGKPVKAAVAGKKTRQRQQQKGHRNH